MGSFKGREAVICASQHVHAAMTAAYDFSQCISLNSFAPPQTGLSDYPSDIELSSWKPERDRPNLRQREKTNMASMTQLWVSAPASFFPSRPIHGPGIRFLSVGWLARLETFHRLSQERQKSFSKACNALYILRSP